MYNEAKSPILAILLTAIIVGGGMYWYNNKDGENIVEEPEENEVVTESEEEVVVPAPIVEKTLPVGTTPVVNNEAESEEPEFTAETVFEPQTFTNKIYKYSIDFPKNWYWHHYGKDPDLAAFDTKSLPETTGQDYPGKVMVYRLSGESYKEALGNAYALMHITERKYILSGGQEVTIIRGEYPNSGALSLLAFISNKGNTYMIQIVGDINQNLTPEDEKIFEQMVASFRFEGQSQFSR